MKQIPKIAGIMWYKSEEDFLAARSIFADAFLLPDTYKDFLIRFSHDVKVAEARGFKVIKAEFDPGTFVAWCNARNLNVDTHGREAFAHAAAIKFFKENVKL